MIGKTVITHITAWIVYIFYEVSILIIVAPGSISWIDTILAFILNAALFYGNALFIMKRFSSHKNYYFTIFSVLVLIFLYMVASWALTVYIYPLIHGTSAPKSIVTRLFLAQHVWRAVYFLGLSTGYWIAKKNILTERKLRLLEKEAYDQSLKENELKRQMAVSQLAFVKAQINPHFLHNTLNFFYSNIYPLSEELARSILLLSDIMRYTFNHTDENGLGDLAIELEQIRNYIQLNQLRFNSQLQIILKVKGDANRKKITSFILMTLVENAFKHGDLFDAGHPLLIDVLIKDEKIRCEISNKKKKNKYEFTSYGIGMNNLDSHLRLVYGDDYLLRIEDSLDQYKCLLELKLL